MKKRKIIIQAVTGCFLAILVVWAIGSVVLTSPTLYEYSPDFGISLRANGSFKQQRGENWVSCDYGKLGFEKNEQSKLDSPKPKCLIYGDSYIEAVMIPGKNRMQNQIVSDKYDVLGLGFSGISAIEYTYLMRRTPKVINNVEYHIIFIGDTSDIKNLSPLLCDGMQTGSLPIQPSSKLDHLSYLYRFFAFRTLFRRWKSYKIDFLGNHWRYEKQTKNQKEISDIRGVCKALKKSAGTIPLLIVYAPTVPRIDKNRLLFSDEETVFAQELENSCLENQIDFLNMESIFCEDFKKNRKFTSGFFNTPPGEGHMNSRGHKLVADTITKYLSGK